MTQRPVTELQRKEKLEPELQQRGGLGFSIKSIGGHSVFEAFLGFILVGLVTVTFVACFCQWVLSWPAAHPCRTGL